ncbi:serine/arginine-rich splicing factor SR45a-like isoform X2 [Phoenix dactylifera]|uniref:Serine/arginine-rich splicing factor SR45a-like isoform X2 n=1 Tax=Phoenix dactylifera TaxID=42345 RepID=A0A8B7BXI9_PHODC|nr:serine/arginine-rich splicing factor SR45a-like isoform X2 [Phoenix dactylifera]XP_008787413.1 serine/arginine-rich splicing factor SR45a-like isoform X2 [Phoenix dactylifera]
MSQSKEVRYTSRSITPPPNRHSRSRSLSRSRGRSRSRSQDCRDARNPGNNLYVTGLSTRVTSSDLEKYFSNEGRVQECHVVMDPRTKESRGFGFVTMETLEDADRCVKYLNRSVLEGRLITVEKAKRRHGRTPTPGKYCGERERRGCGRRHSRSYSPHRPSRGQRQRSHSPYGRGSQSRRRDRSTSPTSDGNLRSD